MPTGVRESDSAIIKRSLVSLENKVNAQNDEIKALKAQIAELISLLTTQSVGSCANTPIVTKRKQQENKPEFSQLAKKKTTPASQTKAKVSEKKNSITTSQQNRSGPSKQTTKTAAAVVVKQTIDKDVNTSALLAVQQESKDDENEWNVAMNRKRNIRKQQERRSKQITRCSGQISHLLVAADTYTYKYLHVWGAKPNTTADNVQKYILTNNPDAVCTVSKMTTRRQDEYASFKNIDIDGVSQVQRMLSKEDVTSLAYLLYDSHEVSFTALERLTLLQQLEHQGEDKLNLLLDWVSQARKNENWKHKFLEALSVCQLYNVIKKLGFSVTFVKSYFQLDNKDFVSAINPVKKVLYKLADNMTCKDLEKLKKTLDDKDIKNYEQCELIFLKLEMNKTIRITNNDRDLNNLLNIFKINFKELYCKYLEIYDNQNENKVSGSTTPSETDEQPMVELIDKMLAELNNEHLKSDKKHFLNQATTYQIKSKQRIGLCHIINQEKFKSACPKSELDDRAGSYRDKTKLNKIMTQLKYNVKVDDNLTKKMFLQSIQSSIQEDFLPNDSIYILIILSHGIKGHVYGADCIPINLDVIKDTIDSNKKLQGVPKVIIIQACQENNSDFSMLNMQADGPNNKTNSHYIKRSDFLIYWATAPDYQAFRLPSKGSIFIQILCIILKKFADFHDLYEIFTKVTYIVTKIFSEKTDKDQLPLFESTLRKKLYLKVPS